MSISANGDMIPQTTGQPLSIVFIGAGNVATHLAQAFEKSDVGNVVQVFSRSIDSAKELAHKLHAAEFVNDPSEIVHDADVYVVSLVDHAVDNVIKEIPRNNALWLHTSGSLPIEALTGKSDRTGVFYPLQTFSKQVPVDMTEVPIFIEGCNPGITDEIRHMAEKMSEKVYYADGDLRRRMHVAAVFACNFSNHMFTIADDLLRRDGLTLEVLHPLLRETVRKAIDGCPADGQTGPAVRGDKAVMEKHQSMLTRELADIYSIISKSIYSRHNPD